jgi:hypothetical protein
LPEWGYRTAVFDTWRQNCKLNCKKREGNRNRIKRQQEKEGKGRDGEKAMKENTKLAKKDRRNNGRSEKREGKDKRNIKEKKTI